MHHSDRDSRDHARRGVFYALVAATLFGISAPFSKLLLHEAKPQLFAGLLYLGSGTGLALFWIWRRATTGRSTNALTRRDLPWLAGAVLAGGILAPLCLITGIALTPASTASLLLNLEAVFTAGLAWFVFGEAFHKRIAFGMLVIIAGGVVLSWSGRMESSGFVGPLLVAASTFCWGLDNNLTQKISSGDALQLGMIKGLVAGSVNTSLAFAFGASWPGAGRCGAHATAASETTPKIATRLRATAALGTTEVRVIYRSPAMRSRQKAAGLVISFSVKRTPSDANRPRPPLAAKSRSTRSPTR